MSCEPPLKKELNSSQKEAANLLSQGLNNARTAEAIGCDRVTIGKWRKKPEFQEYLNQLIEDRKRTVTESAVKKCFDRASSIEEWKLARIRANQLKLEFGIEILEKMRSRMKDLPTEAYPPSAIAPLVNAGNVMVETGLGSWGEAIDLAEAKPTYHAEMEAVQKLVDANILPNSVKVEISAALDEFEKKTVKAISSGGAVTVNALQHEIVDVEISNY
ncbi:MAG: hypothetical protein HWQ38_18950 [Nostoc sp. NMS7]|uniref:phBC6A51 family helix-turn-helix protein n=1 Tax=Nostoc sp. NMS7 TaxID=2815391 RepID=UPI0025E6454A|nr:phBC6A51 family helix-turn-helix protein [Nostoc sp. NMS7]MBN3948415.1 hypothetical protein [Nostoc sp. NMS7]